MNFREIALGLGAACSIATANCNPEFETWQWDKIGIEVKNWVEQTVAYFHTVLSEWTTIDMVKKHCPWLEFKLESQSWEWETFTQKYEVKGEVEKVIENVNKVDWIVAGKIMDAYMDFANSDLD